MFLAVLFGVVATLFVPAQAQHGAPDLSGEWHYDNFVQPFVFPGDRRIELRGIALWTTDATKTGVMFTCSDEIGFTLKIAFAPQNLIEKPIYEVRRRRPRTTRIFIGDDEPIITKFGYMPQQKAAISFEHEPAAKVYNAAILRRTVRVRIPGKPEVDVHLPEADATFARFRENCPQISPKGS